MSDAVRIEFNGVSYQVMSREVGQPSTLLGRVDRGRFPVTVGRFDGGGSY